jgi:hypothetical protein
MFSVVMMGMRAMSRVCIGFKKGTFFYGFIEIFSEFHNNTNSNKPSPSYKYISIELWELKENKPRQKHKKIFKSLSKFVYSLFAGNNLVFSSKFFTKLF